MNRHSLRMSKLKSQTVHTSTPTEMQLNNEMLQRLYHSNNPSLVNLPPQKIRMQVSKNSHQNSLAFSISSSIKNSPHQYLFGRKNEEIGHSTQPLRQELHDEPSI